MERLQIKPKMFESVRCLAKVWLPDTKKRKIEPKTSDGIFLSYAEHSPIGFFSLIIMCLIVKPS